MKRLLGCFLVLLMLSGCSSAKPEETVTPEATEATTNKGYANMSDYNLKDGHNFLEAEYEDLIKAIENKETGTYYIGRVTCPWCLEATPVLNQVAKDNGQSIHYINTSSEASKSAEGEQNQGIVIELLAEHLLESEGVPALFIPNVVFLKDGEVVLNHIGAVGDFDISQRSMTEEEAQELYNIYLSGFEAQK